MRKVDNLIHNEPLRGPDIWSAYSYLTALLFFTV